MGSHLRKDRVRDAVLALNNWRSNVQSQTAQHLFPFLSVVRKAQGERKDIPYEESDDYAFYDEFMRVGSDTACPYFDPLTRQFRIHTHPHSNVATARKNTFYRRWNAISIREQDGKSFIDFNPKTIQILAEKVFERANVKHRLNVIDLAVWLYRYQEFDDGAEVSAIADRFRSEFKFTDDEFNVIFFFEDEPTQMVFTDIACDRDDVDSDIASIAIRNQEPVTEEPKTLSTKMPSDDSVWLDVQAIIGFGTSGIVLRGPPGTGKSWYAAQIANMLAEDDSSRIFRIQFHPSFGYEDFVEGFVPNESRASGFALQDKILMKAVQRAHEVDSRIVLVIDEINRGDTSRIFGELLTYIEHGWRGVEFSLRLSGRTTRIPRNLVILGTMNPHDRSVTQLDMALLRRFDQIDISPSTEMVSSFVSDAGFPPARSRVICEWFEQLQRIVPFGIGHTFFKGVGNIATLEIMWRYRLLPYCQSLLEFEPAQLSALTRGYESVQHKLRSEPQNA